MVDDGTLQLRESEVTAIRHVRFRDLGCFPLTGAVESEAATQYAIIAKMRAWVTSERRGQLGDFDQSGSMEKKREGYF